MVGGGLWGFITLFGHSDPCIIEHSLSHLFPHYNYFRFYGKVILRHHSLCLVFVLWLAVNVCVCHAARHQYADAKCFSWLQINIHWWWQISQNKIAAKMNWIAKVCAQNLPTHKLSVFLCFVKCRSPYASWQRTRENRNKSRCRINGMKHWCWSRCAYVTRARAGTAVTHAYRNVPNKVNQSQSRSPYTFGQSPQMKSHEIAPQISYIYLFNFLFFPFWYSSSVSFVWQLQQFAAQANQRPLKTHKKSDKYRQNEQSEKRNENKWNDIHISHSHMKMDVGFYSFVRVFFFQIYFFFAFCSEQKSWSGIDGMEEWNGHERTQRPKRRSRSNVE